MSTIATQVPGGTSPRQTGPGEHAGENWRSSGRGVEGVSSRGWRSKASRPGSHQAAPAGGNLAAADITLSDDELGQLTDASSEDRSGRSLPPDLLEAQTNLSRDAKTTMREVGSTTYDWTRLGLKIGRLALGCMSYGNPTTPSSKVVTKEVVTTEN